MITLNTLAGNVAGRIFNFRLEHFIAQKDTEALVNWNGRAMNEKVPVEDERNVIFDALDIIRGDNVKTSVTHRTLPITYQRMLFDQAQGGTLHNQVATFRSYDAAKAFMKQKNLWHPAFSVQKEKRVLQVDDMIHLSISEEKFRSTPRDWERRGCLIPKGHFLGRVTLRKFQHRQRMIRDQAAAFLRKQGVLNPSREMLNATMNAESVNFAMIAN